MRSHVFALGALLALVAVSARADEAKNAPRVVVVGVDQKTLDALGPWGGRYRPHHPKLIEQLNKAGVRGIAFDIYLPENPDFADATAAIARAAKASEAPVVIARHKDEANAAVLRENQVAEGSVMVTRALDVKEHAIGIEARVIDMAIPERFQGLRPLSVELALRAKVFTPEESEKFVETITTGYEKGKRVTMRGYIPSSGDPKNVTTVSYLDVLQGKVDRKVLEGALVVVGMTDGKNDIHPHPVTGADISGVYFHAFAVERFVRVMAAAAEAKAAEAKAAEAKAAAAKEPASTPGFVRRVGKAR